VKGQKSGQPVVYFITNGLLTNSDFETKSPDTLRRIEIAIKNGAGFIQIREKNLSTLNIFKLTTLAVGLSKGSNSRVLVSERFDVAIAAAAHGVHLTSKSLGVENARRACPEGFIIGCSTHSFAEAADARRSGADYAIFGPVFDTPSKRKFGKPKGIDTLERVCRELSGFSVFAIGGIDSGNLDLVLRTGVAGFAGIGMFEDDAVYKAINAVIINESK
jgi:thiamine-phosphate pyrophosphorylase